MTLPVTPDLPLPATSRTFTLRSATLADIELIADIHARSRAVTYRGMLPDDYLDNHLAAESLALWQTRMPALIAGAGEAMLAELGGKTIGFICLLGPDEHGSVLVDNLHMQPDSKGTGAGTVLLDAAQVWAHRRGARQLHLFVIEANVAAMGFYASRGWRQAGQKADHMGGVDIVAWRYEMPLGAVD